MTYWLVGCPCGRYVKVKERHDFSVLPCAICRSEGKDKETMWPKN